jgi:hypothetical protein
MSAPRRARFCIDICRFRASAMANARREWLLPANCPCKNGTSAHRGRVTGQPDRTRKSGSCPDRRQSTRKSLESGAWGKRSCDLNDLPLIHTWIAAQEKVLSYPVAGTRLTNDPIGRTFNLRATPSCPAKASPPGEAFIFLLYVPSIEQG